MQKQKIRVGVLLLAGLFLLPQLSQAEAIDMVDIPGGSFVMGDDHFKGDDVKPEHTVRIRAFKMSKYEVTQAQYQAVMGANPSKLKGKNLPVEQVSWFDVQDFIERLNVQSGRYYRLPTEAEWEYAARAGKDGEAWSWGNSEGNAYKYAWYNDNSHRETHPVGGKHPNGFGLYDMHGNVWEWVEDCRNHGYSGAPADGSAWASGDCSMRVLRGGSLRNSPPYMRSAIRFANAADDRLFPYGFRLVEE